MHNFMIHPKTNISLRDMYKYLLKRDEGHNFFTPFEFIERIFKSKLNSFLVNTNKIAILYTIEMAIVLIEDYGIDPKNITIFGDSIKKKKVAKILGINYYSISVLYEKNVDMKFDVVLGNPPFNVRTDDDSTLTGVSGDTKLFKELTKIAGTIVKKNGVLTLITPKGILNTLRKSSKSNSLIPTFECIELNYMSEYNHPEWNYDTCFFSLVNNSQGNGKLFLSDYILSKIVDLNSDNWNCDVTNKSDKELIRDGVWNNGSVEVIRYLPGKRGPNPIKDFMNPSTSSYFDGPRLTGTMLDSMTSLTVSDCPILAGTTVTFKFNSTSEAEKFKLFIKNNKAVQYAKRKGQFKKLLLGLIPKIKSFDLSQIITGYEYPTEWKLTNAEIKDIEDFIG